MSQSRKRPAVGILLLPPVPVLHSPASALSCHLRSYEEVAAPHFVPGRGLDVRRPSVEDTDRRGVSCAVAAVCAYRVASVHVFIQMAQLGCDGISRNASQSVPAVV